VVAYGEAGTVLRRELADRHADLVAMATHGRSAAGRWPYGSVADGVLQRASVPVLLVPKHVTTEWPNDGPLRILVPLDGSELSEAVLTPVAAFARRLGATLVLVRVVIWPPYAQANPGELLIAEDWDNELAAARIYLARVVDRFQTTEILGSGPPLPDVRYRAELGRPAEGVIVRVAEDERVDLVAMATHGRGGLARLMLGSVTTGVVQHANTPRLLVRPAALGAPESAERELQLTLTVPEAELLERGLTELLSHASTGSTQSVEMRALLSRVETLAGNERAPSPVQSR
jgi:nucleotide-binding universal stress UspA family protein